MVAGTKLNNNNTSNNTNDDEITIKVITNGERQFINNFLKADEKLLAAT